MKQAYERIELKITRFSDEDVITTSDRNNAYLEENALDQTVDAARAVPNR